jgi:hypothetical protein
VNLTLEYSSDEHQSPSDVKADAHMMLADFESYLANVHAWVCDVEGGRATLIGG